MIGAGSAGLGTLLAVSLAVAGFSPAAVPVAAASAAQALAAAEDEVRERIRMAIEKRARNAPLAESNTLHDSAAVLTAHRVMTGLEVLKLRNYDVLQGRRVGLVTNHTGVDRHFRTTIDLLHEAPGVKLLAIFAPEHGIRGTLDGDVKSGRDVRTGLPVYSLYGATRRPTKSMLKGIDCLVFDIQDIGARFYTYITTMGYCMEECARHGLRFVVLDRPNPIAGVAVEGPPMDPVFTSFTGYHALPVRHGMTVGELAVLFNTERKIGCDLVIVAQNGWTRDMYFDQTGLPWINTSPNIRSLASAILYPGVGSLEGTNLSVGRGTPSPFELVGAPYIDGAALARRLNARQIPGVRFNPIRFTPRESIYAGKRCGGVSISITDRSLLDSVRLGLEIAVALHRLYPSQHDLRGYRSMIGQEWVLDRVNRRWEADQIQEAWRPSLERFEKIRARYLIYPVGAANVAAIPAAAADPVASPADPTAAATSSDSRRRRRTRPR